MYVPAFILSYILLQMDPDWGENMDIFYVNLRLGIFYAGAVCHPLTGEL